MNGDSPLKAYPLKNGRHYGRQKKENNVFTNFNLFLARQWTTMNVKIGTLNRFYDKTIFKKCNKPFGETLDHFCRFIDF
jgi:hypothetical protein